MKISGLFFTLLLVISSAASVKAQAPSTSPNYFGTTSPATASPRPTITGSDDRDKDPIVGRWRWYQQKSIAQFFADGSVRNGGGMGVWKSVKTETVQRKYEISWDGGLIIDSLTLSEDGKKLNIRNSRGQTFNALKVVE